MRMYLIISAADEGAQARRTARLTCFPQHFYTPRTDLPDAAVANTKPIKTLNACALEISKPGRLLALDLGDKRVGVAVSDELRISVRPLPALRRTSWKQLVREVAALVKDFDAQTLVIGLPLGLDGAENTATVEMRRQARNLELSLDIPVTLQDERLTSVAAERSLLDAGYQQHELRERVDSQAAALILQDYLAQT